MGGSTHRYFIVFPDRDLFMLQTHDIPALDWSLWHDSLMSYWRRFGRPGLEQVSLDVDRHIDFEYNPSWGNAGYALVKKIVYGASHAELRHLWFIDYRIKRNPRVRAPSTKQEQELAQGVVLAPWQRLNGPRVFNTGRRRFAEVWEGQLGHGPGHYHTWDAGSEVPSGSVINMAWRGLSIGL